MIRELTAVCLLLHYLPPGTVSVEPEHQHPCWGWTNNLRICLINSLID